MKNFLCALLLCGALRAAGQVALEHTYSPVSVLSAVLFSSNGTKLYTVDTGAGGFVRLYNTDHTFWRSVNAPAIAGYKFVFLNMLSDNFFNSDNSVEAVFIYYKLGSSPSEYKTVLTGETGSVLFDFGACSGGNALYLEGTYKYSTRMPATNEVRVYGVPGTLPCGHCGMVGIPKSAATEGAVLLAPAPNPAGGDVVLRFGLPEGADAGTLSVTNAAGQVVRAIPVRGYMHEVTIATEGMAGGLYVCSLTGVGFAPVSTMLEVR